MEGKERAQDVEQHENPQSFKRGQVKKRASKKYGNQGHEYAPVFYAKS